MEESNLKKEAWNNQHLLSMRGKQNLNSRKKSKVFKENCIF
jgi:hypothetical protein